MESRIPQMRVLLIREGLGRGSWISYPDLRELLDRLQIDFPQHAESLGLLDQALLSAMLNRDEGGEASPRSEP